MKKGFTLIELLAVILILAVILLIAVPVFTSLLQATKQKLLIVSVQRIVKDVDTLLLAKAENEIKDEIILQVKNGIEQDYSHAIFETYKFSDNIIEGYIKIKTNNDFEIVVTDGKSVVTRSSNTENIVTNYSEGCCMVDTDIVDIIQYIETNEIRLYPKFTSSVRFDQTIGQKKNAEYFSVLTFNSPGWDERGLLQFEIPDLATEDIESVELLAYYYTGDIPSRQQTHPVRRVTVPWTETDLLPNSSMTDNYNCAMTSIDTSNYGYGWRKCNIADIFSYWLTNPNENYGLVIDHNRGQANAGGFWNMMQYYSMNADSDFIPYIKVTLKEPIQRPYFVLEPEFTSSVRYDQTIGQSKNAEYFSVLTFNEPGWDERGLLKFDMPNLGEYKIYGADLFAYYYTGDIPSRQQTHPVRRVTVPWTETDLLPNSSMTDNYNCAMTSIDSSNYGYGWRKCNIVDIAQYWGTNPNENYGLVIDHNRGEQNAGGWWNRMQYYSNNNLNFKPYIIVYLE